MGDAVTYGTELAVGIVSLAAAVGIARSNAPRSLAVVFAVAGVAACVHALAELLT